MKDRMENVLIKAKEIARQLDKQIKELSQKEPVNLCPECSLFCEERFTDGICK